MKPLLFPEIIGVMSVVPSPKPYPPPWIQKSTGSFAVELEGAYTLRYKQSSFPGMNGAFGTDGYACGQIGPNAAAEVTLRDGSGACGAFQRRFPIGGAAYRIL
jgi:hypothetical protein